MKGALHYLHFALPFSIFLVRSHLSGYPLANRHFALLPRSNTKCEVWGFHKWQFYLDGGFRLVFKRPDRPLIWISMLLKWHHGGRPRGEKALKAVLVEQPDSRRPRSRSSRSAAPSRGAFSRDAWNFENSRGNTCSGHAAGSKSPGCCFRHI